MVKETFHWTDCFLSWHGGKVRQGSNYHFLPLTACLQKTFRPSCYHRSNRCFMFELLLEKKNRSLHCSKSTTHTRIYSSYIKWSLPFQQLQGYRSYRKIYVFFFSIHFWLMDSVGDGPPWVLYKKCDHFCPWSSALEASAVGLCKPHFTRPATTSRNTPCSTSEKMEWPVAHSSLLHLLAFRTNNADSPENQPHQMHRLQSLCSRLWKIAKHVWRLISFVASSKTPTFQLCFTVYCWGKENEAGRMGNMWRPAAHGPLHQAVYWQSVYRFQVFLLCLKWQWGKSYCIHFCCNNVKALRLFR